MVSRPVLRADVAPLDARSRRSSVETGRHMTDLAVYAGLFLSALLAATLLPMQSEAALTGLLLAGDYPMAALLAVASIGNVAGSVVNWALGRAVERYRRARWFPVTKTALARAQGWYHRFGRWSLLLSWAPIVGDPLTLAAGIMREPFLPFLALVTIAKTGRYLAIAALAWPWM
jgi:membrane protein YqaA with SNARE-associated domain